MSESTLTGLAHENNLTEQGMLRMRTKGKSVVVAAVISAVLTVCATALIVAPNADAYLRIIRVNHNSIAYVGGWHISASASYGASIRAFGAADREAYYSKNHCKAWWGRLGVTIDYWDYSGGEACFDGGFVNSIAIRGRAGRNSWRTGLGLRIGDSVGRLRAMYPGARRTGGTYLLSPFWTPIGSGGWSSPVAARIARNKVDTFILPIAGAGE